MGVGKTNKARLVLQRLRGQEDVEQEVTEIKEDLEQSTGAKKQSELTSILCLILERTLSSLFPSFYPPFIPPMIKFSNLICHAVMLVGFLPTITMCSLILPNRVMS